MKNYLIKYKELTEKILYEIKKEELENALKVMDERELLLKEMSNINIDKNIDLINQIPNIETVEPMTHCLDDFIYELREDEVEESVDIDDLLENCDDASNGEVIVPKVVE